MCACALGVAAALLVTACSAGLTPRRHRRSTAATRHTSVAGESTDLRQPITDAATTVPLAARLKAARDPGDPDWLTTAEGSLWVKRDDGKVSGLDLPSARPTGEVPTGYSGVPACQGLAYDGTSLWSCAGANRLVRIDPRTRTAGPRLRVSCPSDETRFVARANGCGSSTAVRRR